MLNKRLRQSKPLSRVKLVRGVKFAYDTFNKAKNSVAIKAVLRRYQQVIGIPCVIAASLFRLHSQDDFVFDFKV